MHYHANCMLDIITCELIVRGNQINHSTTEHQVGKDTKNHLVGPFLVKHDLDWMSWHPCPAKS